MRKGDFLETLLGSEKASLASQNWSGHFLNFNLLSGDVNCSEASQTHIPNLMMIAMEKLNRNTNTNQQQCKRQKQTNQLEDPCYDILIIQYFPVWWWIYHTGYPAHTIRFTGLRVWSFLDHFTSVFVSISNMITITLKMMIIIVLQW